MARRPGKTRKTTRRTAAPARRRSTKAPAKTTTRPTRRAAAKKPTAPKRAAKTVAKKRPVKRTAPKPARKAAPRVVSGKPVARKAVAAKPAPAKPTGRTPKVAPKTVPTPAPARKTAVAKPAAAPRKAPVGKATTPATVVAPPIAPPPVATVQVPPAEKPRQIAAPIKEMRRVPPVPKRNVAVPVIDLDPEDQETELPLFPSTPSSLDVDHAPQRVREDEATDAIGRKPRAGVDEAVVAGDPDADANAAATTGDEAPGGENPTPGQDDVDLIGRSLGVEYDDDEELRGGAEIYERDRHRWELDPASSDDFRDRLKDGLGPKRSKG
jgi:hypothetical protein